MKAKATRGEILATYDETLSLTETGRRCGVSRQRVGQIVGARQHLNAERRDAIIEYFVLEADYAAYEIRAVTGIAARYVRHWRTTHEMQPTRGCVPKPTPHGTENGYAHYDCRCIPCKRAHADGQIARRRHRLHLPMDVPVRAFSRSPHPGGRLLPARYRGPVWDAAVGE